ncbi:MAG: hypothetical protein ACUZ8H_03225 [Candidatus Anammoxibacter sp.]
MNKEQAIQDAKDRTERTGLTWYAVRMRVKRYLWFFWSYSYTTVTFHHEEQWNKLYKSGHFKKVYICEPEMETELDLNKSIGMFQHPMYPQ